MVTVLKIFPIDFLRNYRFKLKYFFLLWYFGLLEFFEETQLTCSSKGTRSLSAQGGLHINW
eukprot:5186084-Amphidinium_carterae.1